LLPYSTNELWNETLSDALGQAGGGPEISHMLGIEMKKSTPIKQYHNGVDYQYAVQFCCYLELGGRRVIYALLRHTNQQTMQVRRIIAYLCSREHVHALYQSFYVWPLDSSSVEAATVDIELEQAFVRVRWKYHNVSQHGIPSDWETKKYIQMGHGFLVIVFHVLKSISKCKGIGQQQHLASKIQCRSYNPGIHNQLIRDEGIVHMNQHEDGSQCYFHLQSKLFGFIVHQPCNLSTLDGLPWDPGGVHGSGIRAIAWGQAMFRRGGNVTPVPLGLVFMGLGPRYMGWWSLAIRERSSSSGEAAKKWIRLMPFPSPVSLCSQSFAVLLL
jgi:hypothetical protein